jgi:hypothetical protein
MRPDVRQAIEGRELCDRLDAFTQRVNGRNLCVIGNQCDDCEVEYCSMRRSDMMTAQIAELVEDAREVGDSLMSVPLLGALLTKMFG